MVATYLVPLSICLLLAAVFCLTAVMVLHRGDDVDLLVVALSVGKDAQIAQSVKVAVELHRVTADATDCHRRVLVLQCDAGVHMGLVARGSRALTDTHNI